MRKLATIRKIKDVQPIPNADAIEKIQIDGWWCVSKKGEFKVNDHCVYFEIDSLLPPVEPFTFLEKSGRKQITHNGKLVEGYRLRTIKLRKQLSQGLALPLSSFPNNKFLTIVGTDVTKELNIIKYEPPIPVCMSGNIEKPFPSFIPKTDEERIQNCTDLLDEHKGKTFTITEKLDGTSCTLYNFNNEFGVCGRNWQLKESEGNIYWKIVRKYNIKDNLPDGYAIQGEIIGEGIQKNPLKRTGQEYRVFYVYDINNKKYLETNEMLEFISKLNIDSVPIVHSKMVLNSNVDDILEMANRKSLICQMYDAEGIVFRLNGVEEKISFKAISNNFLLNEE